MQRNRTRSFLVFWRPPGGDRSAHHSHPFWPPIKLCHKEYLSLCSPYSIISLPPYHMHLTHFCDTSMLGHLSCLVIDTRILIQQRHAMLHHTLTTCSLSVHSSKTKIVSSQINRRHQPRLQHLLIIIRRQVELVETSMTRRQPIRAWVAVD